LVTPVPLSPLLLLCCAYGGGSIKISLQAMPYKWLKKTGNVKQKPWEGSKNNMKCKIELNNLKLPSKKIRERL
jgi:hypothetical protein